MASFSRGALLPVWVGVGASLLSLAGVVWLASLWEPSTEKPEPPPPPPVASSATETPRPMGQDTGAFKPTPPPPTSPPIVPGAVIPAPAPAVADPDAAYHATYRAAHDALEQELDRRRAAVRQRCFGGSAQGPSVGVTYQYVIDADGRELARGVVESRDEAPLPLRLCLRQLPHEPMQIPPPGRKLSIEVAVSYP